MTDFIAIISILGGIQGLFVTILLLAVKKQSIKANKFLASVVFILAITLIIAFLHFSRLVLKVPHLYNVTPLLTLLYGPLLFFYVKSVLEPEKEFSIWQLLHFSPFLLFIKLQWGFLSMAGETKASYLMNIFEDRYLPAFNLQSLIRITHLAFYLALCLVIYCRCRKAQSSPKSLQKRRFSWVKMVVSSSLIIWGVYTFLHFYNQHWLNQTVPIVISVSLYGIGYYGFKFPELFRNVYVKEINSKYEFSRLREDEKDLYSSKLVQIMKHERIYTEPDLKLQTLAKRLDISHQNLSQIINERFHQNFSEFVNSFRVDEAKRLLIDAAHQHLTIVAIANDVGFNSKSAFNTTFKKLTKQTPTEYMKSNTPSG